LSLSLENATALRAGDAGRLFRVSRRSGAGGAAVAAPEALDALLARGARGLPRPFTLQQLTDALARLHKVGMKSP
jgi:hypothetical protein